MVKKYLDHKYLILYIVMFESGHNIIDSKILALSINTVMYSRFKLDNFS